MQFRKATGGLWVTGAVLIGGCAPRTEIVLLQPEPDGAPHELHVASEWAAFAPADGTDHLLLGWPWPGAHGGRRVFELYLRVPQSDGTYSAGASAEDAPAATGLFYQNTGRAAGRTCLLDGTISVSGGRSGGGAWREGAFHLTCRDGTRLAGTFRAKRSRVTLMRFEDDHAADVRDALKRADNRRRLATTSPEAAAAPNPSGGTAAERTPSAGTP